MDERERIMHQRKRWLQERELEKNMEEFGMQDQQIDDIQNGGKILTELATKITEKMQKEFKQQTKFSKEMKVEKAISEEISQNTCGICYELMVPPKYSPILLFPCGHTFCKACVFQGHSNQQIQKCPFCRKKVNSSAVNISLQNLICIYTNNKHLLNQQNEEEEQEKQKKIQKLTKNDEQTNNDDNIEQFEENLKIINLRYKILKEEQNEIQKINNKITNEISTNNQITSKLEKEKKEVQQQIQKLEQELLLIDEFLQKTNIETNQIEKKLTENNQKLELINTSLDPIRKERQKYQLLLNTCQQKQNQF